MKGEGMWNGNPKRPRSKKDNDLGEIALSRHNLPPRKICPGNPGQWCNWAAELLSVHWESKIDKVKIMNNIRDRPEGANNMSWESCAGPLDGKPQRSNFLKKEGLRRATCEWLEFHTAFPLCFNEPSKPFGGLSVWFRLEKRCSF